MTRTETARVEACDAPGIERILRGGWATDFKAVLLAHEVPALCTLDEALRDRPVTRFLVYKLFAHCNVYTIQTYCGEKSAEYEASRAARTLLAGAARETGTNMRLHLNKKRDELVLPTGCAGSASSEAPYAIADYDVMNSVALRFKDCKLGTTWFSLMKLLVDLDALGLGQDADKDMLCAALAERVEGARGDSARLATLFRDERKARGLVRNRGSTRRRSTRRSRTIRTSPTPSGTSASYPSVIRERARPSTHGKAAAASRVTAKIASSKRFATPGARSHGSSRTAPRCPARRSCPFPTISAQRSLGSTAWGAR